MFAVKSKMTRKNYLLDQNILLSGWNIFLVRSEQFTCQIRSLYMSDWVTLHVRSDPCLIGSLSMLGQNTPEHIICQVESPHCFKPAIWDMNVFQPNM